MMIQRQSGRTGPRYTDRGATLVIVMVILVVMTFLGLGAMSDTGLQLAMVRNSQMQASAHTAALTEINAQLDDINGNAAGATDDVVLDLVQAATTVSNGVRMRQTSPDRLLDSVMGVDTDAGDSSPFTASLTLVEPNADTFIPVVGYSLSPDASVKWLVMEFRSSATVRHTSTASDQVQGFRYLSAN